MSLVLKMAQFQLWHLSASMHGSTQWYNNPFVGKLQLGNGVHEWVVPAGHATGHSFIVLLHCI